MSDGSQPGPPAERLRKHWQYWATAVTASGRQVCIYLQDGEETKADAITKTLRNTPNGTLGGATAMVNAAISAYCHQFSGRHLQ
jgi:hypothetical protein